MDNNLNLKLLALFMIVMFFIFLISGFYFFNKIYSSIFRLSYSQINSSLVGIEAKCKKISDCELLPGDILIRRYITSRTWLFDKIAHPYFTHLAFYLGDDRLVEAVGKEKNPKDDIQIAILSKSDWLNSDINNFVIIRPKNYSNKLDTIKNNLKNIAEDPNYVFGLPEGGRKKATCADLIFNQLRIENIIVTSDAPRIITPDYFFWLTKESPKDFEIIGYNTFGNR